MMESKPLVTVSILLYKSEDTLGPTLKSLKEQTYGRTEVIAVDNASRDMSMEIFRKEFPDNEPIRFDRNTGFAGGNNAAIKRARGKYVFALNDDVELEKDYIEKLVEFMEENPGAGSSSGFLYKLSGGKRTKLADGVEIAVKPNLRFFTKLEGRKPEAIPGKPWEAWGLSAAATIYRTEALQDIALGDGEFFDSDFLAYKEDVDLSWRLQKRGWKAFVVPAAVAYHERGVSNKEGVSEARNAIDHMKRDHFVNYLAFRNHKLMLYKNMTTQLMLRYGTAVKWFEAKKFIFTLLFSRKLLKAFWDAKKMKSKMLEKREKIVQNEAVTSEESIIKWIGK